MTRVTPMVVMPEPVPPKPWERQPAETSKAYEAFCIYRDMGAKRSVQGTATALAKSVQVIKVWSSKFDWVARTVAWDSLPIRAEAEAYEDMAARIAAQHERLATKLTARLEENLDLLPRGTDPSIKWSTAHGAARQGHAFAADLSKPKAEIQDQISTAIAKLVQQLTEE